MSIVPAELKYAPTHEWASLEADGIWVVGITDHAQDALGDVVFVELPAPGRQVIAGEACALIESVKTASDIHAPVAGEVMAVNTAVADAPETVNADAYTAWLFKIRPTQPGDIEALLDAEGYKACIA